MILTIKFKDLKSKKDSTMGVDLINKEFNFTYSGMNQQYEIPFSKKTMPALQKIVKKYVK